MAFITPQPRIRGLSVFVGGTVAAVLVAGFVATGVIDLGFGGPDVRIDASGAAAWPSYPE